MTTTSADYDLNKQFTRSTTSSPRGVDLILLNAADAKAIEPAVKRAQAAGIVVVAVDVAAAGADATVQTNNVQAGEIACQFIAEKIGGKGNVIIQNGPQVSAVIDRVKGCKAVLAKSPDIKILSDDQDAKGSREGGLNVMQGHLTRFPKIDARVRHQRSAGDRLRPRGQAAQPQEHRHHLGRRRPGHRGGAEGRQPRRRPRPARTPTRWRSRRSPSATTS